MCIHVEEYVTSDNYGLGGYGQFSNMPEQFHASGCYNHLRLSKYGLTPKVLLKLVGVD